MQMVWLSVEITANATDVLQVKLQTAAPLNVQIFKYCANVLRSWLPKKQSICVSNSEHTDF